MDCRTARFLLEFAPLETSPSAAAPTPTSSDTLRDGHPVGSSPLAVTRGPGPELAPEEAQALDRHLAECAECAELAAADQAVRRRIGAAVRAVPLPDRLRHRLLAHLEAEREHWYRKFFRRSMTRVMAAAAVVFAVGGLWYWNARHPAAVNVDERLNEVAARLMNPTPDTVEAWFFSQRHRRTVAPRAFNYAFLTHYDLSSFQDQTVPFLLFTRGTEQVRVWVLSDQQFDLTSVAEAAAVDSGNTSNWKVAVIPCSQNEHFCYLVMYNGESLAPFYDTHPAAG